jgi:hypothetical protein
LFTGYEKIKSELTQPTNQNNIYLVPKISAEGEFHTVDISIGICTYYRGLDGSSYPHQSAILIIKYSIENVNCIPISPEGCSQFAFLTLGDKAVLDNKYYTSLHEKNLHEKKQNSTATSSFSNNSITNLYSVISTSDRNIADKSSQVHSDGNSI